ncbi:toll-like receptor 13 [Sardina pilchardus]|uniref:toll-like receptor 13 n=1 Tax=Sardina pilchardus TaxID=27697 RepID=UPI002E0E150E
MSDTCLVLDAASPYPRYDTWYSSWCTSGERTAVCQKVSDVTLDLAGVPNDIQVLCVDGQSGLVLQPDVFARFHSLRSIYITGLSAVFPGAFRGQTNLHLLSLVSPQHTNMSVASKALDDLQSLEELTLGNCVLSGMAPDVFAGLKQLKSLHVSSQDEEFSELLCRLLDVSASLENLQVTMEKVVTLTTPNCSGGLKAFNITGIILYFDTFQNAQESEWDRCRSLESIALFSFLDMSYINLSFIHTLRHTLRVGNVRPSGSDTWNMQVFNLSLIFRTFPQRLADLSIQSMSLMTLFIAVDSAPNVDLKLSLSGEQIVLLGCERRFVKSVSILQVAANQLLCGPDSSAALGHFSSVVQLRLTQRSLSTAQDLSGLNNLLHLKHLDLQSVNFINLPGLNVMFHNLTRLESLGLYDCWLDSLEGSLAVDLRSLKYLYLEISSETSMTEAFFEPLVSLKSVIIVQLQLRCNCENAWFNEWARQQKRVEVFPYRSQQGALQCQSGGRLEELARYGREHCSLDVGLVLFGSTAAFLLLFMLAVLVQQLAAEYLRAFFHIAHGWLDEALRRNTRGRYLYDAFVSYSGRDERWVVEQLLPGLERRGPPFLRLCLHSRDFQLGKDVVENITDSLYRSRRTLCLLSRHFLRSNWCSLELRLATYRLQVEHRDVLVLLFLEKIPSRLLTAHHRLARLVKTRTYIDWPQDPAQQEAFWERLWAKLAPPRD